MTLIVRPISKEDFNQVLALSSHAKAGLTTLPYDKAVIRARINESLKSFSQKSRKPKGETYLFVMEDIEKKKIVGTCALISKVGGFEPFYTYEIKTAIKRSKTLKVNKKIQYLQLLRRHAGPSEIGSLFLLPQYRKHGAGRLLSLSRFLFMAQYRSCFEKTVLAEMRGFFDKNQRSPFWETVVKHFFDVDFKKADLLVMKDKSFIEDLFPQHPIYIPLLTKAAQKVMGKVHPNTKPAVHMLLKEGFCYSNEIDIFEAGPVLEATTASIRTVKQSRIRKVGGIKTELAGPKYLVAKINKFEDFRVAMSSVKEKSDKSIIIDEACANALNVKVNSKVRIVRMK